VLKQLSQPAAGDPKRKKELEQMSENLRKLKDQMKGKVIEIGTESADLLLSAGGDMGAVLRPLQPIEEHEGSSSSSSLSESEAPLNRVHWTNDDEGASPRLPGQDASPAPGKTRKSKASAAVTRWKRAKITVLVAAPPRLAVSGRNSAPIDVEEVKFNTHYSVRRSAEKVTIAGGGLRKTLEAVPRPSSVASRGSPRHAGSPRNTRGSPRSRATTRGSPRSLGVVSSSSDSKKAQRLRDYSFSIGDAPVQTSGSIPESGADAGSHTPDQLQQVESRKPSQLGTAAKELAETLRLARTTTLESATSAKDSSRPSSAKEKKLAELVDSCRPLSAREPIRSRQFSDLIHLASEGWTNVNRQCDFPCFRAVSAGIVFDRNFSVGELAQHGRAQRSLRLASLCFELPVVT